MSAEQELKGKLAKYPSDEFYIDEHVLHKLRGHGQLDLEELLQKLKTGDYWKVSINDSKNPPLSQYDSYKVFIVKSSNIMYSAVIYLPDKGILDKPLIKTVYKVDKSAQENLKQ